MPIVKHIDSQTCGQTKPYVPRHIYSGAYKLAYKHVRLGWRKTERRAYHGRNSKPPEPRFHNVDVQFCKRIIFVARKIVAAPDGISGLQIKFGIELSFKEEVRFF